jgi:hypothetical protein
VRWLFFPPIPGVPLIKRFQYVGLARSGRMISDPGDAAIVRTFIGRELGRRWMPGGWWWDVALGLVVVGLIVVAVLSGTEAWWVGVAVALAGTAYSTVFTRFWLRGYRSTARANGWYELLPPSEFPISEPPADAISRPPTPPMPGP